ncbi:uncharacterized protein LOC135503379 [Lineus longissimus]|uniref:uncharacterized protein LOC135503379 n=1 Tax=Lineus longissimus TaxID=88925 RepID=UPI00315CE0DE
MENLKEEVTGAFSNFRRKFQWKIVDAEEMSRFVAFSHELDGVLACLTAKYAQSVGRAESRRHQLVQIYPAVIKEIGLVHKQLLRLMRANAPRRNVRIFRDMPTEVFEEVRALVSTNDYKTTIKVTRATTTIAITSWEKVLVLFNFWAMETNPATPRNSLLRKVDGEGNSMMVVVNDTHPLTLTMRHNANRFFVFASFEVLNKFGVAQ